MAGGAISSAPPSPAASAPRADPLSPPMAGWTGATAVLGTLILNERSLQVARNASNDKGRYLRRYVGPSRGYPPPIESPAMGPCWHPTLGPWDPAGTLRRGGLEKGEGTPLPTQNIERKLNSGIELKSDLHRYIRVPQPLPSRR